MAPGFKGVLAGLDINLGDIIGKLFPVDGNTRYEELECIGLNPNQDTLVGIILVKAVLRLFRRPCALQAVRNSSRSGPISITTAH